MHLKAFVKKKLFSMKVNCIIIIYNIVIIMVGFYVALTLLTLYWSHGDVTTFLVKEDFEDLLVALLQARTDT
jgi:hypothetical protein